MPLTVLLNFLLGSAPWLFPIDNTSSTPLSPSVPPLLLRHESSIILTIPTQTIPVKSFVYLRESTPSKIRLAIHVAKDIVIRTEFYPLIKGSNPTLTLKEEVWSLAVPPTIEESIEFYPTITVHLEELGASKPRKQRRGVYHCDIFWPIRFLFCLVKWILCFPCAVLLKIVRILTRGVGKGIEVTAAAVGSFRAIGKSNKVNWLKALRANSKEVSNDGGESGGGDSELVFQILPTDRGGQGFFFEVPSPQQCVLRVKWRPPPLLSEKKPFDNVGYRGTNIYRNYPCTTDYLLASEGLNNTVKLLQDSYAADPVDPLGLSSWHPPPIHRVVAIYGINVPTEVSGVYKRNNCVRLTSLVHSEKDLCVTQLLVLDKSATLKGLDGYTIEGGIVRETKDSTQTIVDGTTETISGDGTVPYWSLQHCRTWQGKGVKTCDVKVYELPGAEHRAILNEAKFHEILLDVIGCN